MQKGIVVALIKRSQTSCGISSSHITSFLFLSGVRNTTGFFYLNGNWRIDFPRAREFAGTTFHYERKVNGGVGIFAPEVIRALGPTTEPLFIVVSIATYNPQ